MSKTATFIKTIRTWTSDARLYRLSEPATFGLYDDSPDRTEYVIVSAVNAPLSGPETYIFPATEDGVAISMLEMDGSFKGGLDHAEALRRAGYEAAA